MLLRGDFMRFDHLVKHNGIFYPAGTEVPVGKVELIDDVPAGALDENADGRTNVYDEFGSKVATVSEEEAEQLKSEAGEIVEVQPKRDRKAKKA